MPQVLDTQGINGKLMDIVCESRQFLILISPFVRFGPVIRKSIENADSRGVNIIVVYGKTEMSAQEYRWIRSLKHIQIRFSETLHAKVYSNENEAIVCSMNLYDYSQVNNEELGMTLNSEKVDSEPFQDLLEHIDRIIDRSSIEYATFTYKHTKKASFAKPPVHEAIFEPLPGPMEGDRTPHASKSRENTDAVSDAISDHCIRCGKTASDRAFYCDQCLKQWMRFGNMDYPERFCALCGKSSTTSAAKPVCKDCFSKNETYVMKKRDYLKKMSKDDRETDFIPFRISSDRRNPDARKGSR